MKNERATKKQQALLEFVRQFIKDHDYGPSYREIMTALGYKSVSTVAIHVDGLIAKGFLTRRDNSPRSLEIVHELANQPPSNKQLFSVIDKKLADTTLSSDDQQILMQAKEILSK